MKIAKKMKERILSLALVFVMVVSLVAGMTPVEAHAEEAADTYEVTISTTNFAEDAMLGVMIVDPEGYETDDPLIENVANGQKVNVPAGYGMLIMSNIKNFEVIVDNEDLANVSDIMHGEMESGYWISEINGPITVDVKTFGYNIIDKIDVEINKNFLLDLSDGSFGPNYAPFKLGDSSEGIYFIEDPNDYVLYDSDGQRVSYGEDVDIKTQTYYIQQMVFIKEQGSKNRFANQMSALSGDEDFTFELASFSDLDEDVSLNFGATICYEIRPTRLGETYDITLDKTKFEGEVALYTYDRIGANVENTAENQAKVSMPVDGMVRVFVPEPCLIVAEGANVSGLIGSDEGGYYEITNFTDDTTVVVCPKKVGDSISDFGDDSIKVENNNVIFDTPDNDDEFFYVRVVFPKTHLGGSEAAVEEYCKMLNKGKVNTVIDATILESSLDAIKEAGYADNGQIYALSAPEIEFDENSVPISEKAVAFVIKLHRANVKVVEGQYVYAVYGVHAEVVTPTEASKPEVHTHSFTEVPAKAATCTTPGNKAYYTCSGCDGLFADKEGTTTTADAVKVAALGHDWTGDWDTTKEATATEEGKKETYCKRDCGQKKVAIISKVGEVDENGKLEKDAEVEPEAPITEATLNNSKTELIAAGNIFSETEKGLIESGTAARVWIEISKTNEATIKEADKSKMEEEATEIMGEDVKIAYFDVDLFKQVGDALKQEITEPGVAIKITITIPEELLNHDKTLTREYKIIRLHDANGVSEIDVINGEFDAETGEFSFETDKFSTYAIAYGDTPVEAETPVVPEVPNTGDSNFAYIYVLMLISGLAIVFRARKAR